MTPNFEALSDLALQVAAAEAQHAKAVAAVTAAEEARNAIAARIVDLSGRRGAVVVRRREGDHRDTDGAELSLIDADLEGLRALEAEHEAAVGAARAPERAAAGAVANARLELRRGEARALEAAAVARVQAAADALVAGLHLARQARGELGGGPVRWAVSDELWNALVPLRHGRMW